MGEEREVLQREESHIVDLLMGYLEVEESQAELAAKTTWT
jgi:hypothetical protein